MKKFISISLIGLALAFSAQALNVGGVNVKIPGGSGQNTEHSGQTYIDNSAKGAEKASYDMKAYLKSQFTTDSVMINGASFEAISSKLSEKYGAPKTDHGTSKTWAQAAVDEPGKCGELTITRIDESHARYKTSVGICN